MSSVRMCDSCGRVFSEREPGWQTGAVLKMGVGGVEERLMQDRCPQCAVAEPAYALPITRMGDVIDQAPRRDVLGPAPAAAELGSSK